MGWADGMGATCLLPWESGIWVTVTGICSLRMRKRTPRLKWDTFLKACPAGQGLNKIPWFEKGQKPGRC